jgi:hypothetical protein
VSRAEKWRSNCDDIATILEMYDEDPEGSMSLLGEALSTVYSLEKDLIH